MRCGLTRSLLETLCIALTIGLPSAFGQPAAAPKMPAVAQPPASTPGPPSPAAWAEKVKHIVDVRFDQSYAGNDNPRQMVDVYLPRKRADDRPLPVIAMIHGGGWSSGERNGWLIGDAIALVRSGSYAAVTVGYRLSNEAKWPAQIHDCKAAIRWIRGHAAELGLDPDRIGVTGGSAGGHLALMLGLTGGIKTLDGSIGDCTDQPSGVTCVVNFCGPSDLSASLLVGEKAQVPDSVVTSLMGGDPSTVTKRAVEASPLTYVTKDAPPVLTLHGTKDERVDFRHAETIDEALKKAGATSYLVPVVNAGHHIPPPPQLMARIDRFWGRYLRGETAEISTDPIEAAPPPAAKPVPPSPAEVAERVKDIIEVRFDQPYAGNDNPRQMVDVYLPRKRADGKPLPVVAMIHGGGWAGGDRKGFIGDAIALVRTGSYAAVAVGYRLSGEAKWPAQIHDCKAAIRWIRGHAKELGVDPDRIGATGGSAGGHLSLLMGTSGSVDTLDGTIGDCTDQPSGVTCVVNWCGPSDLFTPLFVGEEAKRSDPAVVGLIGGSVADLPDRVREASPVTYVSKDSPPVLTLHGTKDLRVDFKQAEIIDAALKKAGATSYLVPVVNAGHGIPKPPELQKRVQQFWNRYLRDVPAEISTTPIEVPPAPAAP